MKPTVSQQQVDYVETVARLGVMNLPPGGESMIEVINDLLPADAGVIVDVGCNTGWVSAHIARARPDATIIGIDLSQAMIATAQTRHVLPNLRFVEVDVSLHDKALTKIDAAFCAGSSAFFGDRVAALAALRRSLGRDGTFVDAHYVYEPTVSEALRQRERDAFGIVSTPRSAAECLKPYEDAGMIVRSYTRKARWFMTERPGAEVYRSILASLPGMAPVVAEMVAARSLIGELARHRHPVLVVAGGTGTTLSPGTSAPADTALRVMALFSVAMPRQPIAQLRQMLPYELLAYVGDPDAAPGGAAAVRHVAQVLTELGLDESSEVLDVGSFTGMSTFVLASSFPCVLGIDIDARFVDAATVIGQIVESPARFECMDAATTTFASSSHDAVVMTATLGYTPKPARLVAEAMRILRPGGFFVEFFYHHPIRTEDVREQVRRGVGPDVRIASLSSQIDDVETAGFRLVRAERVEVGGASEHGIENICAGVEEAERRRNPSLDSAAFAEFGQLLRQSLKRVDLGDASATPYLCVFEKPGSTDDEESRDR